MWPVGRFPYTSFTNINLNWILNKLKEQVSGLVSSVNGMTGDVTVPTIPSGGSTGEILAKQTNDDYDTEWIAAPSAPVTSVNGNTGAVTVPTIPSGGTSGQILAKQTNDDYDTEWIASPSAPVTSVNGNTGAVTVPTIPSGGTTGQVLSKQDTDDYSVEWSTPPVTSVNGNTGAVTVPAIPSGGSSGQILAKQSATDYDVGWTTVPTAPVTSVNSKTGSVILGFGDVSAIGVYRAASAGAGGTNYDLTQYTGYSNFVIIVGSPNGPDNNSIYFVNTTYNKVRLLGNAANDITISVTSGVMTIESANYSAAVWICLLPSA